MKVHRMRFTVRWMMVAVAVMSVASLFVKAWMNQRAAYCRSQAEWSAHEQWRMGMSRDVQLREAGRAKDPTVTSFLAYDAGRYRQGINWHARREQDYRRAMWRLWEPIPNAPRDPPWPAIPANLFPPGVNPKDYSITPDGRWGSRVQMSGTASSSRQ
jgi:hypothetical protein